MPKNPPDERVVYLALKTTFRGADAQVRKPKKIRELILKKQNDIDIQKLIKEHNIDILCNVARSLLEQQVFESTLQAKIRFPEVFEVSPAQSAERSASEEEAARTEVNAIIVASGLQSSREPYRADVNATPSSKRESLATQASKRSFPYATVDVPSLYPVYLPYSIQHRLLVKVQTVLEEICYDFGKDKMKSMMEREGWDCAESVELNKWVQIFLSNQDKLSPEQLETLVKRPSELLTSVAQIRHTAVHRLRITAVLLEELMVDAEALARLLCDDGRIQMLGRLRRDLQLTTDELKRNKDLLESKLNSTLRKINDQRDELTRLERMAVEEMLREDREYQALAGANLDRLIPFPEIMMYSEAPTEVDGRSEPDTDADPEACASTSNEPGGMR